MSNLKDTSFYVVDFFVIIFLTSLSSVFNPLCFDFKFLYKFLPFAEKKRTNHACFSFLSTVIVDGLLEIENG